MGNNSRTSSLAASSLSLHPTGNYVTQKLLSSCDDKAEFDSWFEKELDAGVEDVLAAGNTGVVLAVAQGCNAIDI